jgi:hypothetical protein
MLASRNHPQAHARVAARKEDALGKKAWARPALDGRERRSLEQQAKATVPKSDGWFRPGTSGNPGGRPRDIGDARAHAQEYAGRIIFSLMRQATSPAYPCRDRRAACKLLLRIGFGGESGIGPGILRQLGWQRLRDQLQECARWDEQEHGKANKAPLT